jgi:hypothetical protein
MENFTGVRFDSELGEFEAVVNGEVEGHGNTAREAHAKLQECLLWCATVAAKQAPVAQAAHNAPQAAQVAETTKEAPATQTAPQIKPSAPRCPFYKAVKRCYAIFAECGLSVEDDAMRETLAKLLQKPVPSRKVLSGADWMRAGDRAKWRMNA